jgi:hypothetical protein
MRLTTDSPLFLDALLVAFAGFVAMILWVAVSRARFVHRLRARHPDLWSEIQQPPPSSPADPAEKRLWRGGARVTGYLYTRGFRSLDDPLTRRLGERAWRASLLFIGYTVVGTGLVLALIGLAGP